MPSQSPRAMCRSEWHTPAALMWISASSNPGSGIGTVADVELAVLEPCCLHVGSPSVVVRPICHTAGDPVRPWASRAQCPSESLHIVDGDREGRVAEQAGGRHARHRAPEADAEALTAVGREREAEVLEGHVRRSCRLDQRVRAARFGTGDVLDRRRHAPRSEAGRQHPLAVRGCRHLHVCRRRCDREGQRRQPVPAVEPEPELLRDADCGGSRRTWPFAVPRGPRGRGDLPAARDRFLPRACRRGLPTPPERSCTRHGAACGSWPSRSVGACSSSAHSMIASRPGGKMLGRRWIASSLRGLTSVRERPPASSSPPSASWSSPTIACATGSPSPVSSIRRDSSTRASIGAPWVNDDTSCVELFVDARTVQVALSFHAAAVPNGRSGDSSAPRARPRPRSRPLHRAGGRRRPPPTASDGRRRRTPRAGAGSRRRRPRAAARSPAPTPRTRAR